MPIFNFKPGEMVPGEVLEEWASAVTSKLTAVDKILKARGLGVDMVMVFRCGESGLFYPADYAKEWGRKYGIGLGPHVCSEALQSDYHSDLPAITPAIRRIEQIMHPVRNCCGQMDWDLVEARDAETGAAVLAQGDEDMTMRAPILRAKQMANPLGRIKLLQAQWARERGEQ